MGARDGVCGESQVCDWDSDGDEGLGELSVWECNSGDWGMGAGAAHTPRSTLRRRTGCPGEVLGASPGSETWLGLVLLLRKALGISIREPRRRLDGDVGFATRSGPSAAALVSVLPIAAVGLIVTEADLAVSVIVVPLVLLV